jgi:uncharacterized protein DUF6968
MATIDLKRQVRCELAGKTRNIEITIGPVTRDSDSGAWTCECNVPLVMTQARKAYGEDALQALVLALEMCREGIRGFDDGETQRVWWHTKGDNGGF